MVFQAILLYLYPQEQDLLERFREGNLHLNSKPYREFQKKIFDRSYLDEELKLQKTIKAIRNFNLDIFFLQEANDYLV